MIGLEEEGQEFYGEQKSGKAADEAAEEVASTLPQEDAFASTDDLIEACLLVGPPGSGKTSFLTAIARAGMLAAGSGSTCLPLGHATWLVQDACRALRRSDPLAAPSLRDASYSFELRAPEDRSMEGVKRLIVYDLSGAELFAIAGESGAERAVASQPVDLASAQAKGTQYLVLCIDVLDPRSDDWEVVLVGLIDNLASPAEEKRPGSPALVHRPPRGPRLLGFDRILLLFNRLDLLCQQASESSTSWDRATPDGKLGPASSALSHALRRLRPYDFAKRIDPVAQAFDLLGEAAFAMLLSSMKPGAELGVGFVSAGGFDADTGLPFLRPDGGPASQQTEREDVLRSWRPFGVLEALDFLVWGRTAATIHVVDRRVLAWQRRVRWI